MDNIIPLEKIENKIYLIRGQKVMIDSDLASLYGVKVKRLNEQVKRNAKRFPEDFMFQLTRYEAEYLEREIAHLMAKILQGRNLRQLKIRILAQKVV